MSHRVWIDPLLGPARYPFLAAVAAMTLVLGFFATQIRLDAENEAMNARRRERHEIYQDFQRTFGSDDVLLLTVTHPDLLGTEGLSLLDDLTRSLGALEGVARVESLTTARQVVSGPYGAEDAPLIPRPLAADETRDRAARALDRNPHVTGLLISADRGTSALLVELADGADSRTLIEAVRSLARRYSDGEAELHLTGVPVQKSDAARFVNRDQRVLLPVSAVVLAAILWLVFRRRSAVVLPLLVTAITVVWNLGLYVLLGFTVNIITSLLPLAVMVLAIATSIHLYSGWTASAELDQSPEERVRVLVDRLFTPCLLTAVTTALGLASLTVSDVPAVRQFGLFGALGALLSFVLNITLLPVVMSRLSPPRPAPHRLDLLGPPLRASARLSTRHPGAVVATTAVLVAASLAGITRIRNNTDLVRFLSADADLLRDTRFIDDHLGAVNALELVVERNDGAPLTGLDDIRHLDRFLERVRELDLVTTAIGLPELLRQLHSAELELAELTLPDDADDLRYCFDLLAAADRWNDIRRVVTPDFRRTRIHVRTRSVGTALTARIIEEIEAASDQVLGTAYRLTLTGQFYNVTVDSNSLVRSQVESFSIAIVMVLATMVIVFRSARLLVAALIPNLAPVLWTGGVMGWLGIELSTATAMVASVVIGIAVDDTIHYLARYRREDRGDAAEAVGRTTSCTGRVLTIASFVLAAGFWVGALGSFRPTVYFSLLTGATILGALVCDLLVLPACLVLFHRRASSGSPDAPAAPS